MSAKAFRWVWVVGAIAISATMGATAGAQNSAPCGVVALGMMAYTASVWRGGPYSATVKTTRDQTLADGNAIHMSATTHQARDAAGRTRSEVATGCIYGADGSYQPLRRVSVFDPATGIRLNWAENDPSAKVVHVFHQADAAPPVPASAETVKRQQAAQRQYVARRKSEDLGSKVIQGVMTKGSRTVMTIPAGEEGNELPLEIVDEIWVAKDLGLTMLSINSNPANGRWTKEVVELHQGEPDAALFIAPEGYKVEEQHPVAAEPQ
jgi:hypothetical protein